MDLEAILWSVQLLSRSPPPPFTALFASQDTSKLSQSSSSLCTSYLTFFNLSITITSDVVFSKALGQRQVHGYRNRIIF